MYFYDMVVKTGIFAIWHTFSASDNSREETRNKMREQPWFNAENIWNRNVCVNCKIRKNVAYVLPDVNLGQ